MDSLISGGVALGCDFTVCRHGGGRTGDLPYTSSAPDRHRPTHLPDRARSRACVGERLNRPDRKPRRRKTDSVNRKQRVWVAHWGSSFLRSVVLVRKRSCVRRDARRRGCTAWIGLANGEAWPNAYPPSSHGAIVNLPSSSTKESRAGGTLPHRQRTRLRSSLDAPGAKLRTSRPL
jgi:hypothetical protein